MKRAFFLFVFASLLLGVTACNRPGASNPAKEDSFSKVKRTGVLRVGYIVAPPWIVRDPKTGELSGTSIDTINEIARLMEVKLEFEEANFATFAAGLQSGKYDLSIAPIFSTIPRAKVVAFTQPQMYLGNSAIVRRNETRFKTLEDIDQVGVVVAVTQGEQGHEYAKANFKKAQIKVISGGDQSMTYSEVLAGRADVALGDAWFIGKFVAEHAEARDLFPDSPYNVTPIAWSVRYEDMPLLTFVNTSLDYLDTTGKLDEIFRKHGAKWLRPKKVWTKL
jgi:ABC-type amino acid transport substrate-binding protein